MGLKLTLGIGGNKSGARREVILTEKNQKK